MSVSGFENKEMLLDVDGEGNIEEELSSELDCSASCFELPRPQSEAKLGAAHADEHLAFRVFVHSPFSQSTYSKQGLDCKFLQHAKRPSASEVQPFTPPFTPILHKVSPSGAAKENAQPGPAPPESGVFVPRVSNPKAGGPQQRPPLGDSSSGRLEETEERVQRQIQRFEQGQRNFEQKIKRQQKLKQERELDGCTFHPSLHKGTAPGAGAGGYSESDFLYEEAGPRRPFDEFLRCQEEHVRNVEYKLERERELQEQSSGGVRPLQINKKSLQIVEKQRTIQQQLLQGLDPH